MGAVGGPYTAVARYLDEDWFIREAQRIASRFPGVDPMDVLRSDDFTWQAWLALVRSRDDDIANAKAQALAEAKARG